MCAFSLNNLEYLQECTYLLSMLYQQTQSSQARDFCSSLFLNICKDVKTRQVQSQVCTLTDCKIESTMDIQHLII